MSRLSRVVFAPLVCFDDARRHMRYDAVLGSERMHIARWTVWIGVVGFAHTGSANVVINELLPNPDGTDTGSEYVELYNAGASAVDVSGWTLWAGTSSLSKKAEIPGGTLIPAGGFLVLGESGVSAANVVTGTLSLGNASSSGDAVALRDDFGDTVDTVVYGPNNSDGFLDDAGNPANPAPKPGSGQALGRVVDGVDTDDSGRDFALLGAPSPGGSNGGGGGDCDRADEAVGLVINELLFDADGADTGKEWIELYNGSGASLDLSGYALQSGTKSFSSDSVLPEGLMLPNGGHLLVGGEEVVGREVLLSASLPNASSNSDAVRLVDCDRTPVDTVIYGSPNEDGWVDDRGGIATSLAPKATNGASLARVSDGEDSDQSGVDFVVQGPDTISPGASNPEPPPCDAGATVVINEFLPDPSEDDALYEWVELYNAGTQSISLAGWTLSAGTSGLSGGMILEDIEVGAGEVVLFGRENVVGSAQLLTESLGNATSSSDAVQLRDCLDNVIDTVVYGEPNSDGFEDDNGNVARSLGPKPTSGASLARIQDGYDTNLSRADFVVDSSPTPGLSNPEREPVVCDPAGVSTVVINEALVDADGSDDGYEWIELYNPTASPISVAGWGIAAASDVDDQTVIDAAFPGGVEVPAQGYLVLGGEFVEEADVVVPMSIGNGSNGDALILWDCDGTRVDSVLYGSNNDDLLEDDIGNSPEVTYIVNVASGSSFARVETGVDTNAAGDWFADPTPTPGAENDASGGTGPIPQGRGCNNRDNPPPGPSEPRSGCGGEDLTPAMVGLFAFGLAARRRRSV